MKNFASTFGALCALCVFIFGALTILCRSFLLVIPLMVCFVGVLVCAVLYMYADAAEHERTRRTTTERLNN